MWSAIVNFVKWLFVPDQLWLATQIADLNALMEEKLGLFFWLFNTVKNFFGCFSNLQNYTGFRINTPNGSSVFLFYGEFWTMAMKYINPLLTGLFVVIFSFVLMKRVVRMFEK